MSNSLRPSGQWGPWSPWNSLGHNTRESSLSLFQGILPTQGSNSGLPHCRQMLYRLSHKGSWSCSPLMTQQSWRNVSTYGHGLSYKSVHWSTVRNVKNLETKLSICPVTHKLWILSSYRDSEVKASACNMGDLGSIPGSGRSPGEGNGNPLQYSCLENPMDKEAWWATVHGVAKSRTQLSEWSYWYTVIDKLWILFSYNGIPQRS